MPWLLMTMVSTQLAVAPLQPAQPWAVSEDDNGCTVSRRYPGDAPIDIGFQTVLQSRPAHVFIRGTKASLPSGTGELALTLDGATPVMVRYGSFESDDGSIRLTKLFLDRATIERVSSASVIAIGRALPPLRLNGVREALKAVDSCTSDKLLAWGLDPALYFEDRTAKITGNFAAMFDRRSYPKEAMRKGASGRVVAVLKTDREGAVAECKVVESADPSLDAGTCAVARRGRLTPPLDATGAAIPSYAIFALRWVRS
jgi:TonB family protein